MQDDEPGPGGFGRDTTAPTPVPPAGLEAVFHALRPALLRRAQAMGRPEDAEDVLHDVWLRLGATTGPILNSEAYLFRMVYTTALDRRRAAARAAARDADWASAPDGGPGLAHGAQAERRLIAIQALRRVEERLRGLGEPAETLFRRHRIDGVTQRRLAAETGLSISTVEKYLRRAYAAILDLSDQTP